VAKRLLLISNLLTGLSTQDFMLIHHEFIKFTQERV